MQSEIPSELAEKKLKSLNPHWGTGRIDETVVPPKRRKYFNLFFPLASQFDVQRAVVMMGPRRVGKTVMLLQSIQAFIDLGLDPKNIVYFPLDILLTYQDRLENIIDVYFRIYSPENAGQRVMLFDEIQYVRDWAVQLKGLVDTFRNTQFIVSGSAAGALKRQSLESGAGRFTDFLLPPLSFYEYLDLLDLTDICFTFDEKGAPTPRDINAANTEFINYINYGGFPEAIFNKNVREKPERYIREDIIDKVILRDLPSLYGISDTQELNRLFQYVTYQTGNEISLNELSKKLGVSKNTIGKYLEYLEAAFLIKKVYRVDDTARRFKRENYFKIYLTNPSLFAALYGLVGPDDTEMLGRLVETSIFSQLIHSAELTSLCHYARLKKGGGEVDLVLIDPDFKVTICIEIKWRDGLFHGKTNELKHMIEFLKSNNQKSAIVTTKTELDIKQIDGIDIYFSQSCSVCLQLGKVIIEGKLNRLEGLLERFRQK